MCFGGVCFCGVCHGLLFVVPFHVFDVVYCAFVPYAEFFYGVGYAFASWHSLVSNGCSIVYVVDDAHAACACRFHRADQ